MQIGSKGKTRRKIYNISIEFKGKTGRKIYNITIENGRCKGDVSAFIEDATPYFLKVCLSKYRMYGGEVPPIEDIKQDIALTILTSLPKYSPKKSSIKTFLHTVMRNEIYDKCFRGTTLKWGKHLEGTDAL